MSSINSPIHPSLIAPDFNQAQGPAALDPSRSGTVADQSPQGTPFPAQAPAGTQNPGENTLLARAWEHEGPYRLDDESALRAQFSAMPVPEATSQAADAIIQPMLMSTAVDAA